MRKSRPKQRFELSRVLFQKQLPFVEDESRYITAVCTRRAGKTYACAAKLLDAAMRKKESVALYITLSRLNAKRIVWETLKQLNDENRLGGIALEGELCVVMRNGSRIYLSGAADSAEIEKFRGLPLSVCLIDEAQAFPAFISRLVDEVLVPGLADFAGQLMLVGTPGPVPIGYFHGAALSGEWSHHSWSIFDNPHIERKSGRKPESLLEDELKRRGVTRDDPVIQREWFGAWSVDVNALVFRFDLERNTRPTRTHQRHVTALDFGFDDSDAIAVLGWSENSPEVDIVYEWVGAKQTVSALMERLREVNERFKPIATVADTGGLGKKIAAELEQRTGIPIEPAEKERKLEHIELVNDALRTGKLFAAPGSRFASDCMLVEWDRSNPEKPRIGDQFHSDICDAVLYGYRRALAWLAKPQEAPAPLRGTDEWRARELARQQQEIEAAMEQQMRANLEQQRTEREAVEWL